VFSARKVHIEVLGRSTSQQQGHQFENRDQRACMQPLLKQRSCMATGLTQPGSSCLGGENPERLSTPGNRDPKDLRTKDASLKNTGQERRPVGCTCFFRDVGVPHMLGGTRERPCRLSFSRKLCVCMFQRCSLYFALVENERKTSGQFPRSTNRICNVRSRQHM
jgi:hypothetical protein